MFWLNKRRPFLDIFYAEEVRSLAAEIKVLRSLKFFVTAPPFWITPPRPEIASVLSRAPDRPLMEFRVDPRFFELTGADVNWVEILLATYWIDA